MAGCCSRRKRKEEETVDAEQTNRPKYNSFTQQDLPSCKLVLSPRLVILCLLVVCVVFIPIGVAMFVATQGVYEVSARYDNVCFDKNTQGPWYEYMIAQNWQCQTNCSIVLEVEEDMKAPVYVYYGLRNYFQNHRRYVKSLSYSQLQGGSYSLSECDPIEYVGGNTSLPIVPCGLTAWSNFNDTFQLETSINNSGFQTLEVSDQGIAWEADMKRVFGKVEPENFNTEEFKDYRGGAPIRTSYINQDERFMNWMRISTFSKFKKLWGKVNTDIVAGTTLRINITNCYNSYRIDGEKVFSLSTASWIGGKNDFLPITYLSIGSICGALSILFSILHLRSPRKMGDSRVLSWNKGK